MITGDEFDRLTLLAAAGAVLIIGFMVLVRSPKLALLSWLLVIAFAPIWVGGPVFAYFPAFTVISLLAAFSLVPRLPAVRWSLLDLAFALVLFAVVVMRILRLTTDGGTFDLLTGWAGAFLLGRLIIEAVDQEWLYGAVGVVFSLVAVLAIIEFATSINLFVDFLNTGNQLYQIWSGQQARGGILRAEGAFGHSIALGCSLAVAITLTLCSRFRPWLRTIMVALMGAAVVVTFSRSGMITCALSVLLICLFQRGFLSRVHRGVLLVLITISAVVAFALIGDVFSESGDEAVGSALYRTDLFELVRYMSPFGVASNYTVSTTQVASIGSFASIDNAVLLFGLIYGWVPLLVPLVGLLVAGLWTIARKATPPTIALVAQLPAFFTVALITQYAVVVWFIAGLAISTQLAASRTNHRVGIVDLAYPAPHPQADSLLREVSPR